MDVPLPGFTIRSPVTRETSDINFNSASISVVEPMFLLRNTHSEVLSYCQTYVEEGTVSVDRMPTVNLVDAIISWSFEIRDGIKLTWMVPEPIRTVPLDVDNLVSSLHRIGRSSHR